MSKDRTYFGARANKFFFKNEYRQVHSVLHKSGAKPFMVKKEKTIVRDAFPSSFLLPVTDTWTLDRLGAKRDKHGSANLFVPKTTSQG